MNDSNKSELLSADDFVDDVCFVGPIADYVSDECDSIDDFKWLIEALRSILGVDCERHFSWHCDPNETYIIFNPSFKTAYFQSQYKSFMELVSQTTIDNFSCRQHMQNLEDTVQEKFGFYVASDSFSLEPLDSFIRSIPNEESKFWLWTTIDYHY